jgi:hypothetical protein
MGFSVKVVTLPQRTFTLIGATITAIRWIVEAQANLFLKINANIIAKFTVCATPCAVRLVFAKLTFYAS